MTDPQTPGRGLLLVAGPSGAGKDSVMAGAHAALAGRSDIRFVRRVVTRPTDAGGETHDALDPETFAAREAAGAFALSWRAHGLAYGIPANIRDDLEAGRTVVANISRKAMDEARARFPGCRMALIDAPAALRAERLAARGREDVAAIEARLAREVPVPPAPDIVRIANDGALEDAVSALIALIDAP